MTGWMVLTMLLAPPAAAPLGWLARSPAAVLRLALAAVALAAAAGVCLAVRVFRNGPALLAGGWVHVDALSAWHLLVLAAVFLMSSVFAQSYFRRGPGALTLSEARVFGALWLGAMVSMTLVLVSNNLAILWVGVEATTMVTAFLICTHRSTAALEAMWKYLIMCSVGVAFAFVGTLLLAAAATPFNLGVEALFWTRLQPLAAALDPRLVKMAFIFLLVGYGTKAGLAPLHNWLPDAHSQAPAPVSAVFSGMLLNTALYGIVRTIPLVEAATGRAGWGLEIWSYFAVASLVVAAAFIVSQRDVKRLLAYSSVEHIGVMSLGFAMGGLGPFAALFHMLNHSICKTLCFCAAGRLGQDAGTLELAALRGALRRSPWGLGLTLGLMALIGIAPFAIFMSELLVLRAAIDVRAYARLAVYMGGLLVVFVGVLRHVIDIGWGEPPAGAPPSEWRLTDILMVAAPLAALLALGLWLPSGMVSALTQAAAIVKGGP